MAMRAPPPERFPRISGKAAPVRIAHRVHESPKIGILTATAKVLALMTRLPKFYNNATNVMAYENSPRGS